MPTLITLVDGTIPVAADFNGNYQALNNAIGSSTTISGYTTGDTLYASASNTLSKLAAGTVGKVLTMGASVPSWEGGAWTTPGFSAGDFTASGSQTWTVASGDVTTYAYHLVGKTMTVAYFLETTTVGGTPSTELRIAIPAAKTAAKTMLTTGQVIDNGAAAVVGAVQVTAALTYIALSVSISGGNWTGATDTTSVRGIITFEIQ